MDRIERVFLVNQQFEKLQSIGRSAWRNRWHGLLAAWVVGMVGAVVIYMIPERYEATARVYVDTQTVLKPLMRDLAVQPDIELQVNMLARTLISRKNVEKVIADIDFKDEIGKGGVDALIDSLTRSIRLDVQGRNLYRLSYKDVKPQRAEKVVANFVAFFVDAGLGDSRKDTEDARKFIDEQIKSYEGKLAESENRLKEFKMRNFGYAIGGSRGDQFGQMAQISDDVRKLQVDLRAAEQSRDALRAQLAAENPTLVASSDAILAAVAQRPSEIETRLESQQRNLDDLLRRFTENHPDVIAARRLITQLETQRRQELDARRAQELAASKNSAPTNPVYQRIKIALTEADAQTAALRARVNDQQARLNELRTAAIKVPKLEAEMAQLNRDYDVVRKNYEQLVARRESAAISGKVDESAQLVVFRVVEAPRVAPRPSFPNRMTMIPLLLAGALAAGIAVAVALGKLIPTFDDLRALREISKRPVLGGVSQVSLGGAAGLYGERLAFTMGAGALAIAHVAWLLWSSFGK
jgi:polysaccharide chain length determinant protein (PEP-CTERM system associated)